MSIILTLQNWSFLRFRTTLTELVELITYLIQNRNIYYSNELISLIQKENKSDPAELTFCLISNDSNSDLAEVIS